MRKRSLLLTLVVLATAVTVVVWPRPVRATKENYFHIREGMSRAELEAILGPPGDFRTGLGEEDWNHGPVGQCRDPQGVGDMLPALGGSVVPGWLDISMSDSELGKEAHWVSDSVRIYIIIDAAGCLKYAHVYHRRLTQGPLDRIRWRAERLWHRWFP
jgi:hypothetical protein